MAIKWYVVLPLLLLHLRGVTQAELSPCHKASTQLEMIDCHQQQLDSLEERLSLEYHWLTERLERLGAQDSTLKEDLTLSSMQIVLLSNLQKRWEKLRLERATLRTSFYQGGSLAPLVTLQQQLADTRNQLHFLQQIRLDIGE